MDWKEHRIETRAIHAGDPSPRVEGALVLPVFQSAVFEHTDPDASYHDVLYPRLNNLPNHRQLGQKLAALEGAEAATVTGSGMAAISTTLISVLSGGGHLLVQDQLYGGTHMLVTSHFAGLGFEFDFISATDPDSWRSKLRPNTRAIYAESITNPLMNVIDHEAVVRFAKEHALTSIVDNTFATPVNFRPIEIGYDIAVHSATKYLNGHSDVAAGAIVGSDEKVTKILHLLNELGGTLDPHACFLLARGMKTLALRVRQQNANALALAQFLEGQGAVECVNHPGLPSHPSYAQAAKLFTGTGGMLSFEPQGGLEGAQRFEGKVRIPTNGPSLGGIETLLTRPASTSHRGLSKQERAQLGLADGLIRVSVGVEAIEDLVEDFGQALK